ncbi:MULTISPECIES: deoxyribose-phosphate aldolase [Sanguibacteroides]|uniref:Deoxyribose-phosphate aldolase n=1 Tax=Sanguibacteroides justesenii TaxID=1547597 RepID=A0A0C3MDI2_9PORP|nr:MULTISPECIES: deoxyribose-phosphate aldolase [Sanguibacteroides]KIO44463.1 deoxyribose-phosphate aldolase [Sanguibacteroides justesenii]KIO45281.1 deoxyribose-phosphate aldolase [Sanguibacteroides justesenii]PXZ44841.1 deoxyribose-phosphate aldolase [Sanguibacteroides justesenii]
MENISGILATYNFSNLEDRIEFELDGVIEKEIALAYCPENFELCITCMDYTTLKVTDTDRSVTEFVAELLKKIKKNALPEVASVCVFPKYASIVKNGLSETSIKTTVVGACFPSSQSFMEVKIAECKAAVAAGADEIDVVISVGDILERNYERVYEELAAIREACKGVLLKVILETGELKDIESIFNAALISAYAGADFVKTSTGKVPVNATPESVYVMCEAVRQYHAQTGKMVGIKVAGGVSKVQNAIRYLTIVNHVLGKEWVTPRYFRIGTSQLMDDILKEMKK